MLSIKPPDGAWPDTLEARPSSATQRLEWLIWNAERDTNIEGDTSIEGDTNIGWDTIKIGPGKSHTAALCAQHILSE